MFDLTKLETLDLDNLKELTRKFGEEFSFCKEGVLVLIPGSQQYGYFADSMKGNFWTDTAMKGYVDANVGMSSFLIPNLVIDKPFYVDVTGAMMFMWAAKEKSPISKIEQRNDKDFLVSMASGATFLCSLCPTDYKNGESPTKVEKKKEEENVSFYEKADPYDPDSEDFYYSEEEEYLEGNSEEGTPDVDWQTAYDQQIAKGKKDSEDRFYSYKEQIAGMMYERITAFRKSTEDLDTKIKLSFLLPAHSVKFLHKIAVLFTTSKVKRQETRYLFQFGYKEGIYLENYDKDKVYVSYVVDDDRQIKYKEWSQSHSTTSGLDVVGDVPAEEFMFGIKYDKLKSLREQNYGFQLYECNRDEAGDLGIMAIGLTYGDAHYIKCFGYSMQLKGNVTVGKNKLGRKDYLNAFGVRSVEQEKEYRRLESEELALRKEQGEYAKNFRFVGKLFPIEKGEIEWIAIDGHTHGLKMGHIYYVDEATYSNELKDCMGRNKLTEKQVFEKQKLFAEHPNFSTELKKIKKEYKKDEGGGDKFIADWIGQFESFASDSSSEKEDEELNLKEDLEQAKKEEKELDEFLKMLKQLKRDNKARKKFLKDNPFSSFMKSKRK